MYNACRTLPTKYEREQRRMPLTTTRPLLAGWNLSKQSKQGGTTGSYTTRSVRTLESHGFRQTPEITHGQTSSTRQSPAGMPSIDQRTIARTVHRLCSSCRKRSIDAKNYVGKICEPTLKISVTKSSLNTRNASMVGNKWKVFFPCIPVGLDDFDLS